MKAFIRILPLLQENVNCGFLANRVLKSVSNYKRTHRGITTGDNKNEGKENERELPPEPTQCCMTGCPNCVWIKYAQELTQLYDDGDKLAKKKIMEKVKDQKLRAFLFAQLGLKENEKRP